VQITNALIEKAAFRAYHCLPGFFKRFHPDFAIAAAFPFIRIQP
jgi:hypothetical protein